MPLIYNLPREKREDTHTGLLEAIGHTTALDRSRELSATPFFLLRYENTDDDDARDIAVSLSLAASDESVKKRTTDRSSSSKWNDRSGGSRAQLSLRVT